MYSSPLWKPIFHHTNQKQAIHLAPVRVVSSKCCQWGKDDLFTASDRRYSWANLVWRPLHWHWKRWICKSCRREKVIRFFFYPAFKSGDWRGNDHW